MPFTIRCNRCRNPYDVPSIEPFSLSCPCGVILERKKLHHRVVFNTEHLDKQERVSSIKYNVVIWLGGAVAIIVVFAVAGLLSYAFEKTKSHVDNLVSTDTSVYNGNSATNSSIGTTATTSTVYSGNCTLYKRTFVKPNNKQYTTIKTAFAKVVIDKSAMRFSFFFDGKQVGNWSNFNSHVDGQQGGEGFDMNGEWSAYRLTAERTFTIYKSNIGYNGNDLGYEYEITNYKVN